MKFRDLDQIMRSLESVNNDTMLPELYIVARLDGRSFTRLTKETHDFDKPFDLSFHQLMIDTSQHLMTCGFDVLYAYTQSDEISLLFDRNSQSFGRHQRKYQSILSGEASGFFSLELEQPSAFDCRAVTLPSASRVVDYFRWRQEDAARNALNAWCYWKLRDQQKSGPQATEQLKGLSIPDKHELLFQHGVNFNDLPAWQKRGTGLSWAYKDTTGRNPMTQEVEQSQRREIQVESCLPLKEDYTLFLEELLESKRRAVRS